MKKKISKKEGCFNWTSAKNGRGNKIQKVLKSRRDRETNPGLAAFRAAVTNTAISSRVCMHWRSESPAILLITILHRTWWRTGKKDENKFQKKILYWIKNNRIKRIDELENLEKPEAHLLMSSIFPRGPKLLINHGRHVTVFQVNVTCHKHTGYGTDKFRI